MDVQTRTENTGKIINIETNGIEPIHERERSASLFDFLRLQWGGSNTLASAMLGSFPIILGLSFYQSLAATILGIFIGALILAPMGVFGPITGTNNAVSSGAHFGVVGRIVGSFLSLLTAICFFSLSVWSSGDALIGAICRIFHWTQAQWMFAIAYGIFALCVLVICIYGFQFMLLVNKVAVTLASVVFVVGFVAFGGEFHPDLVTGAGMNLQSPGFWATFIGATLIVMSNPISFGAFLGDWSRYLPEKTPRTRIITATLMAQSCTLLPFLFGLVTTAIIAERAPEFITSVNYTGGLLTVSPTWFFLPLIVLALIGGLSTGATSLYGTGLDFSSVFPGLSRVQATLLIGILSIIIIFVGRFAFDLVTSVTTLVTLIIVTTTPWMVIMMIGFLSRRGFYLKDDLQVFNRGQRGGAYWFHNGWNFRGMIAWIPSAIIALLTVNLPGQFVGPLGNLAGGIDISLVVALLLPAIIYPTLLKLFPEPAAVHPTTSDITNHHPVTGQQPQGALHE
ncbi:purine-cytosine permease family protein [Celerinatantimonas sp. YJH-8]|uniref:purine-cytosine permease family protein n=1 Tax=Celerinatantimonas sp. YJH-8 TaxID=3228714 RepID=UPI0038CB8513